MRRFSFRKINGIYASLAPRAQPEGKNRVLGTPHATRQPYIIYTIDYTLAKAAMSVPKRSIMLVKLQGKIHGGKARAKMAAADDRREDATD